MENVQQKVFEIIAEQLNVDLNDITPEKSFIDDLGADSLDTVQLIMGFEEKFGIEIPDEHSMNIKTVGDAISYIESKI